MNINQSASVFLVEMKYAFTPSVSIMIDLREA
jgi:hypothetical protein